MSETDHSPLMRQYREIKQGYPDAILFFRVGDFYEMFYEDAQEASRLLSIALTSRDKNSPQPVPLCGVPYHAAQSYIAKLLKTGRIVALCEQVEDPKFAKGLVRREVVRVYTPGTLVDTEFLSPTELNYLAAISVDQDLKQSSMIGLACLEMSTGEFWAMEFRGARSVGSVLDELARVDPRELLIPTGLNRQEIGWIDEIKAARLCERPRSSFDQPSSEQLLREHFHVHTLAAFGCQELSIGLGAAGAIFRYLRDTQPTVSPQHIRTLQVRRSGETLHLDGSTIRNLELLKSFGPEGTTDSKPATLLGVLDQTVTAMGSRLLRQWLVRPLTLCDQIRSRLNAVEELKEHLQVRGGLRIALRDVQDITRLSSRLVLGLAGPRELLALKQSLTCLPAIGHHLALLNSQLLADCRSSWDNGSDICELIERAIHPDAPLAARDGNIIKDGYDSTVDELRKASKEGKTWIAELEARERERTGIESLKIRYNQVFGYYIEVSKANLTRIPPDYIRKQTLVNAERFMTPELKALEDRVTGADLKLLACEQELFLQLRTRLAKEAPRLESIASTLSLIDVVASLAEAAARFRYTKPLVTEGSAITIRDGRHPVVEHIDTNSRFVPNDTLLDLTENRLLIITGPNMAGKSTYLRQVALIVLMAQIGSFVPAAEAHIGVVDRIFTRVGASDNLAGGQSTFMVEMVETANILHNATQRSLILLDEIGRGTSTYDGLSIAWAIAEYIHDCTRLGARTLFATHYHEMTQLEEQRLGIKNYRVAVREQDGDVVFLRKIVAGRADRSYGIHVAKLAGLPADVIGRAQAVLSQLEQPERTRAGLIQEPLPLSSTPRPHPIIEEVKQIDLFSITPLDALNRLAELQSMVREDTASTS